MFDISWILWGSHAVFDYIYMSSISYQLANGWKVKPKSKPLIAKLIVKATLSAKLRQFNDLIISLVTNSQDIVHHFPKAPVCVSAFCSLQITQHRLNEDTEPQQTPGRDPGLKDNSATTDISLATLICQCWLQTLQPQFTENLIFISGSGELTLAFCPG